MGGRRCGRHRRSMTTSDQAARRPGSRPSNCSRRSRPRAVTPPVANEDAAREALATHGTACCDRDRGVDHRSGLTLVATEEHGEEPRTGGFGALPRRETHGGGGGFEPTVESPPHTLSRRAPLAARTRPPPTRATGVGSSPKSPVPSTPRRTPIRRSRPAPHARAPASSLDPSRSPASREGRRLSKKSSSRPSTCSRTPPMTSTWCSARRSRVGPTPIRRKPRLVPGPEDDAVDACQHRRPGAHGARLRVTASVRTRPTATTPYAVPPPAARLPPRGRSGPLGFTHVPTRSR